MILLLQNDFFITYLHMHICIIIQLMILINAVCALATILTSYLRYTTQPMIARAKMIRNNAAPTPAPISASILLLSSLLPLKYNGTYVHG